MGQETPNYDESQVPPYVLPDPLTMQDGSPVHEARAWREKRRPEILDLFSREVYGRSPPAPSGIQSRTLVEPQEVFDGGAIRFQVSISLTAMPSGPAMDMLLYVPTRTKKPVPAFLGLNFQGNHAVQPDPGILISERWFRNDDALGYVDHCATERSRGSESTRWPIEKILAKGYAVATVYYGDIDPDLDDGFQNGIHPYFYKPGQTAPAPDEWGSIAAWAWGLSRALDYLETRPDIDAHKVALIGHSRLGKTALWAAAQDERFALVISNNSGCGGAALSKRIFGETVGHINQQFPHWFCGNFKKYSKNEAALPVDQHLLLALIAPRPVYVASAEEDLWADPRGEFLSVLGADPVYQLLGMEGLTEDKMPAIGHPIRGSLGYHIRHGKHDVTDYDWEQYLDFMGRHCAPQP